MKRILFAAVVSCAFAAPAFAAPNSGGHNINVNVSVHNTAFVAQGGNSFGTAANNAQVAQGAVAIVTSPLNAPVINTGRFGAAPLVVEFGAE
jgi:hypothetical protein